MSKSNVISKQSSAANIQSQKAMPPGAAIITDNSHNMNLAGEIDDASSVIA